MSTGDWLEEKPGVVVLGIKVLGQAALGYNLVFFVEGFYKLHFVGPDSFSAVNLI